MTNINASYLKWVIQREDYIGCLIIVFLNIRIGKRKYKAPEEHISGSWRACTRLSKGIYILSTLWSTFYSGRACIVLMQLYSPKKIEEWNLYNLSHWDIKGLYILNFIQCTKKKIKNKKLEKDSPLLYNKHDWNWFWK